jgi:mannose-6-phosphate isomerase-like protein (cupin superfamily)
MPDPEIMTLAERLAATPGPGPVWTHTSTDLNVNLLSFDGGVGVPAHVNAEVDVLIMCVAGTGVVEVDGVSRPLGAGQLLVIPKGASRALRSTGGPFSYLTCHRQRDGLMPL